MIKFLLFLLLPFTIVSQQYKLLPDSCIYCVYGLSDGTSHYMYPYSWNYEGYKIDPKNDTVINGLYYKTVEWTGTLEAYNSYPISASGYQLGIRQDGNQLFGVLKDSINEYLMVDFNAQIGDTIDNIMVTGINADGLIKAKVLGKDSSLLASGEYFSWMYMLGLDIKYPNGTIGNPDPWEFTWAEYSLCGIGGNNSGVIGLGPRESISGGAFSMSHCTSDTLFGHGPFQLGTTYRYCKNCILALSDLSVEEERKIGVKIIPNPSNGIFQITLKDKSWQDKIEKVAIYNSVGEIIEILEYDKNDSLDLTKHPKGIYLVQLISNETKVCTSKIVIH